MKSHGKFNEIGSVTVSGSRTYKKAKEVKNTRLNTGIAFWVAYFLLMVILLLAALGLVAQTVNLTTTRTSMTTATINMAYNGPQTSLGCLSVRMQYDTSLFLCTSITQSGIIENKGNFFPNVTDDKICVSWWVTNFTDTLWSDARPIVKFHLKVKDGCGLFHFIDFEAEWNQLGDIDADVIPATFMDTTACYDSGRRAVMPEFGLNVGRAKFTVKDRKLKN